MPELSKHELDKLFQQGAGKYDFDYNPVAWEQMSRMLDRKRRRLVIWWIVGIAIFLSLSGIAVYFFCAGADEPVNGGSQDQVQTEIGPDKRGQEAVVLNNEAPKTQTFHLQEITQKKRHATSPQTSAPAKPENHKKPQPGRIGSFPSQIKKTENGSYIPLEKNSAIEADRSAVPEPGNQEWVTAKMAKVKPSPPAPLLLKGITLLAELPRELDTGSIAIRQPEKIRNRRANHLLLGAGASAGRNSIGWGDFSKSGWKAGLSAEYQYQRRFGLNIGAQFLKMHYLADKGEYLPPKGFWTRRIAPDNTRGLCHILEVPVSLKFYPKGYSAPGPFVSAGVSSYFMLMEEYWYNYRLDDPDLIRWWQTKDTQSYWLSTAHAYAGYQARLGKGFMLQLDAGLQVPLAGIGHGQLKVYSLGANIKVFRKLW